MFEDLKNNMNDAVEAVQVKYQNMATSAKEFNDDVMEIRDLFVGIKNVITSITSFIGYETGVLLLFTFLFLFIINMIPFILFNKKHRYFCAIGVGTFLSFFFDYGSWSLAKYVLIMLAPILIETALFYLFKKTGKTLFGLLKLLFQFLLSLPKKAFKKLLKRKEKTPEE